MKTSILLKVLLVTVLVSCYEQDDDGSKSLDISELERTSEVEKDSVIIDISSKSSLDGLFFVNGFNETEFLTSAKGSFQIPTTLYNGNYKTSAYFPIDTHIDGLKFSQNDVDNFWYLSSPDSSLFFELNFDVFFRKNVFPLNDVQDFIKYKAFAKPEYFGKPSLRDEAIDYYFKKKQDFLSQYMSEHSLSEEFFEKWTKHIQYERLSRETGFGNSINKYDTSYLNATLRKSLPNVQDDRFLKIDSYRQSCLSILDLLLFVNFGKTDVGFIEEEKVISENFKDGVKDFLMFTLFNKRFSNGEYKRSENFEKSFENYLSISKFQDGVNYLRERLNSNSSGIKEFNVLDVNNNVKPFSELQSKQITYLDFWASWCAPCITEMSGSEKLKGEYSRKGVNFIYLSIDENPVSWSRAMTRIGLVPTESFLLPGGNNSEIAKKFNISSIPRYVILDAEGNVINADAPRPSDPSIKKILDDILNQKVKNPK